MSNWACQHLYLATSRWTNPQENQDFNLHLLTVLVDFPDVGCCWQICQLYCRANPDTALPGTTNVTNIKHRRSNLRIYSLSNRYKSDIPMLNYKEWSAVDCKLNHGRHDCGCKNPLAPAPSLCGYRNRFPSRLIAGARQSPTLSRPNLGCNCCAS